MVRLRVDPRRARADGRVGLVFAVRAARLGKLRAKVAYHREWLQLNTRAKDERALFVPASEAVVERYDDICVICHDNFEVDGARRLTRTTPIKLPRCAHLLHRGCEVCLENAHRTLRPLVCPICTAPMRRGAGPKR